MRTVYIDTEFKCHAIDDGIMRPVETDFFDGKCDAYIEGFRLVPEGAVWVREDGAEFKGQMIAPWKPYEELEEVQRAYEKQLLAEYAAALKTVGVTV
jgi:hypothetical protein